MSLGNRWARLFPGRVEPEYIFRLIGLEREKDRRGDIFPSRARFPASGHCPECKSCFTRRLSWERISIRVPRPLLLYFMAQDGIDKAFPAASRNDNQSVTRFWFLPITGTESWKDTFQKNLLRRWPRPGKGGRVQNAGNGHHLKRLFVHARGRDPVFPGKPEGALNA